MKNKESNKCKFCSKLIKKKRIYCDINCKAEWQRTQKPVTKEWLEQKYLVEKLGTYEIGIIVNRNPKRVYEWLINLKIPTRTVTDALAITVKKDHVKEKHKIASDKRIGVPLSEETKNKLSISHIGKPGLSGSKNPMFGKKGSLNHNWKGGLTADRQKIYTSIEWKKVRKEVLTRDSNCCVKCGYKNQPFKVGNRWISSVCLHHIKSFSDYKELRTEMSNLVTLCKKCHSWVHSKKNIKKEYL